MGLLSSEKEFSQLVGLLSSGYNPQKGSISIVEVLVPLREFTITVYFILHNDKIRKSPCVCKLENTFRIFAEEDTCRFLDVYVYLIFDVYVN